MKKKEKQKNKGITLIALVITIIVLLILAGVTIATLTGDNGILTKASIQTNQGNAEERVQLEVIASIGTDGNINIEDLNDNLQNIEGLTHDGESITNNPIETLQQLWWLMDIM